MPSSDDTKCDLENEEKRKKDLELWHSYVNHRVNLVHQSVPTENRVHHPTRSRISVADPNTTLEMARQSTIVRGCPFPIFATPPRSRKFSTPLWPAPDISLRIYWIILCFESIFFFYSNTSDYQSIAAFMVDVCIQASRITADHVRSEILCIHTLLRVYYIKCTCMFQQLICQ